MVKTRYKRLKKPRKRKRIHDFWTHKEYQRINNMLKKVIDANYEEINASISWTEEELERLKLVKERREKEYHYDRWRKI